MTYALTDSGNAERFAEQHRETALYIGAWKQWLIWDGSRWKRDSRGAVGLLAKETARSIDDEVSEERDDDRRKKLRAHATKSESLAGIKAMIELARAELSADPDDLDRDPWALNVENGTIDLRTGVLREHRREDMFTKVAPVTYSTAAEAPLWYAFLHQVMSGNEGLIRYLQRIVGYALTGVTSEHAMFFSHGDGSNGKSLFHNTIDGVLGDYASKAPRGLLYESKGERHPTELADLFGNRFVLCPEVKQGQRFDDSLIKDLVGEDSLKARRMHQDFWEFTPTHKLFLCGNHKPFVKGTDRGIWRRLRLIPWLVTISREEQDRGLLAKLARERPGILAWAVRGCLEWQRDGLGEPTEVQEATTAYREQQDPVREFLEAKCVFEPDAKVARAVVRTEYESWCKDMGAMPLGAMRFSDSLKERGVTDGGNISRGGELPPANAWRGVRMKTPMEQEMAAE